MTDSQTSNAGQGVSGNPADDKTVRISSSETSKALEKKIGLMQLKEKEEEAMKRAVAMGYPHIDLEKFPISQQAFKQISEAEARQKNVVCFFSTPDELRLGALDPEDKQVKEVAYQLAERTHTQARVFLISEKSLGRALDFYKTIPIVKPISKNVEIKEADLERVKVSIKNFSSLQKLLDRSSITDSLNVILGAALRLDASDVHVEPEEEEIIVRLRLDGVLYDAAKLDKEIFGKLASRVKLVSALKINITATPQDGRFSIKLKEGEVDVRVSIIPTVYGESIVLRLLHQSRQGLSLESLGLRNEDYQLLLKEIKRPNGMIIATGPTGSGKTTTLYAIMQLLNKPGVKIITLEDPVEYKMEGINQSQIEVDKGYTFARGLRSMLRQDPDIAMVGEIRDLDTAEIAVQAALTGHLILSTIHTNNASGAIPRFFSMGVKSYLLAPALNCVIGQRLVRKLCKHCKKPVVLKADQLKQIQQIIAGMPEEARKKINPDKLIFYQGAGCESCGGIGYKGRIGVYEFFIVGKEIEAAILIGQTSEYEVEKLAARFGMTTMVQDGVIKALTGITSVEEVFRVVE